MLAIAISLAVNFHQTSVNEKARREAAISQSQFNLRTCAKGNRTARVVNALKASTFAITKAASDVSGDPSSATARYGALADQIRALPDIPTCRRRTAPRGEAVHADPQLASVTEMC